MATWLWVWWYRIHVLGLADGPSECFMANESAPTIDISALVVALFGCGGDVATGSGVCGLAAKGAMHHGGFLRHGPTKVGDARNYA